MDDLLRLLSDQMPEGPKYFPDDMITDQPERLMCGEIIREKALLNLREEIPHGIGVEMMAINKLSDNLTEIHANIYCERASHKAIIIGKQGAMLRTIGSQARADIEKLMGTQGAAQAVGQGARGLAQPRRATCAPLGYEE